MFSKSLIYHPVKICNFPEGEGASNSNAGRNEIVESGMKLVITSQKYYDEIKL